MSKNSQADPLNPPPPGTEPQSSKRRRDDLSRGGGDSQEDSSAKRRATTQDVIFRVMVPSKQIGKVIGAKGCRIKKIREDTKATIKIADAISRHEERVIIISSKDSGNEVSDAENALQQIASLILKDDENVAEVDKLINAGHVSANTIRLLIAGTQAGSLIGMSGQNIVKLRNSSGASITVLAPNQLPPCASAHESDRVLQIAGELPGVLKAMKEIGCQLRENPPRQVISINPAYNHCPKPPAPQPLDGHVTFPMVIAESLVGGLIGKSGANISRIRNESGATIKVYGDKRTVIQRQIQLSGTQQQVDLAKQMVEEYIYSQLVQVPQPQYPAM